MIKLMHGDCLEVEIEPDSVDMVLYDPPHWTTVCNCDSVIPEEYFSRMVDRCREHGIEDLEVVS